MSRRTSLLLKFSFLLLGATAILAACGGAATASSSSSTSPSSTTQPGSGGGGSNARSGPAAGGAAGTVGSVSTSGFTMSISAGQTVTVDETSSTTYQDATGSTSASAITPGDTVLVLGTTNGTTITATQVTVQPT